ncbi:tetrapyrrole biosynthesis uroporphyrinogen III synthase [Fomitopsis serialis]|uniref:tetrapyrrole biosynthesis uroporphyrinogen III synthase n=1 Tax=Fomitopsis serialis TaxID=139415 RepID=UPI002008CA3A|nr:tetrapyrrole biosynthesis uroporphyrinogen III synthase [Neoantrodia serialis]KAH9919039.1 tetrapyrrole biosynthesis uroporphyrinogen III synthase [Neoantrodia serialis]
MAHVLLLRAPSHDGPDRYESALSDKDLTPVSVPVVETGYTNLDKLKETIVAGPEKGEFGGVIVTSARSCEAWKAVVLELVGEDPEEEAGEATHWSTVPFYVVGEATATALLSIRSIVGKYPGYAPSEENVRGAGSTGTSEKLARFIVDELSSAPPDSARRRLLYLTGDKNRDTLPRVLEEGGVHAVPVQVYETHGSSTFGADLEEALTGKGRDEDGKAGRLLKKSACRSSHKWTVSRSLVPARCWIVYFAPSEAEFTTPVLREHFTLSSSNNDSTAPAGEKPVARIASIGPTTGDFLRNNLGLRVDVVSPKPNPASLAKAIVEFDEAHPW